MKIDYSFKPSINDVVVGFQNDSALDYYHGLREEIYTTANRYGIQINENLTNHSIYENCLIKHVIILADANCCDPIAISKQYEYLLEWYHTMSLAISYDSIENMLKYKKAIEQLKQHYNYRINYLRADISLDNKCINSKQKIIDNLVCDTIRIKYNPIKDETYKVLLDNEAIYFFNTISKIFADYKLYHRSLSDGFIALRCGNGFFITATKTNKHPLDLTRISYVHYYDENRNELIYSGEFLPSSDVVEASFVFRDNPQINGLVHTHASDLFTRNHQFANKIKVGLSSYGIPELGKEINKVIAEYYDDFIILQEHGEVFALTESNVTMPNKMRDILENTITNVCV